MPARASARFAEGDRVGIPWLAQTCRTCRFCTTGRENLCVDPQFTGWDVDGGYAEYLVAEAGLRVSRCRTRSTTWKRRRSCVRASSAIGRCVNRDARRPVGSGIYGFGGSAHLVAQVAIAEGMRVHVLTRAPDARRLALELGAASAGDAATCRRNRSTPRSSSLRSERSCRPALEALDRGGTLAIAGIYLSDIPQLDYDRHLFRERTLRSVTANTRADGIALLRAAAEIPVRVSATPYPFELANDALKDLAHDRVTGAAVLVIDR